MTIIVDTNGDQVGGVVRDDVSGFNFDLMGEELGSLIVANAKYDEFYKLISAERLDAMTRDMEQTHLVAFELAKAFMPKTLTVLTPSRAKRLSENGAENE